jgi:hypothetical protein
MATVRSTPPPAVTASTTPKPPTVASPTTQKLADGHYQATVTQTDLHKSRTVDVVATANTAAEAETMAKRAATYALKTGKVGQERQLLPTGQEPQPGSTLSESVMSKDAKGTVSGSGLYNFVDSKGSVSKIDLGHTQMPSTPGSKTNASKAALAEMGMRSVAAEFDIKHDGYWNAQNGEKGAIAKATALAKVLDGGKAPDKALVAMAKKSLQAVHDANNPKGTRGTQHTTGKKGVSAAFDTAVAKTVTAVAAGFPYAKLSAALDSFVTAKNTFPSHFEAARAVIAAALPDIEKAHHGSLPPKLGQTFFEYTGRRAAQAYADLGPVAKSGGPGAKAAMAAQQTLVANVLGDLKTLHTALAPAYDFGDPAFNKLIRSSLSK